jgi:heme/copper-type cytochrome/quinol oxidase subunit 2
MSIYTILIGVSPLLMQWQPNESEKTVDVREFRMSNSMRSFSMVLGITSICLWLFAMFVFASLIYFLRKYMKSYYDEFFFKVFCQSFSTGIYIFVIIISSWATVIYLNKMEKNTDFDDEIP